MPLTARVLAILRDAERNRTPSSDYVFVGGKVGKPLSNMAMMELLRRMDRRDITVHGFRSTFRDWAAERTNFLGSAPPSLMDNATSPCIL